VYEYCSQFDDDRLQVLLIYLIDHSLAIHAGHITHLSVTHNPC